MSPVTFGGLGRLVLTPRRLSAIGARALIANDRGPDVGLSFVANGDGASGWWRRRRRRDRGRINERQVLRSAHHLRGPHGCGGVDVGPDGNGCFCTRVTEVASRSSAVSLFHLLRHPRSRCSNGVDVIGCARSLHGLPRLDQRWEHLRRPEVGQLPATSRARRAV